MRLLTSRLTAVSQLNPLDVDVHPSFEEWLAFNGVTTLRRERAHYQVWKGTRNQEIHFACSEITKEIARSEGKQERKPTRHLLPLPPYQKPGGIRDNTTMRHVCQLPNRLA